MTFPPILPFRGNSGNGEVKSGLLTVSSILCNMIVVLDDRFRQKWIAWVVFPEVLSFLERVFAS
jgi:hypothetical protein